MNNLSIIEKTRNKYELVAKIAISSLAIVAIAPFIFLLIKGVLGLIAAIVIASTIIALTPAFSLTIANLGVSFLKFEASRNPVETLQNEYKERSLQLEKRKLDIENCTGKFKTFKDKVLELKKKYPEEATKFEEQMVALDSLLNIRKEKYKDAAKELKNFHDIVEKAQAIWEVTQALADTKSGVNRTEEFFSEMKTKTALESVQSSLNHSFAALETSLLEASTEKNLLKNE
jgi:Skp family chaperone for outer membrane proteins